MKCKAYSCLIFICSTLFLLLSINIYGQKNETEIFLREVRVMHEDSVVFAHIKDQTDDIKIDDTKFYYWYSKEKIYKNRGGVHGKILHGNYYVLDKNGQLITDGVYSNGLRTGIWKKWTRLGELKNIREWKEGELNGKATDYDYKGNIEKVQYYKKGKLHGKSITYNKGEPAVTVFKNGKEAEKKQASSKSEKPKIKKENTDQKLIKEKKTKSVNKKKAKQNSKEVSPEEDKNKKNSGSQIKRKKRDKVTEK